MGTEKTKVHRRSGGSQLRRLARRRDRGRARSSCSRKAASSITMQAIRKGSMEWKAGVDPASFSGRKRKIMTAAEGHGGIFPASLDAGVSAKDAIRRKTTPREFRWKIIDRRANFKMRARPRNGSRARNSPCPSPTIPNSNAKWVSGLERASLDQACSGWGSTKILRLPRGSKEEDETASKALQLLNNAVTGGLTVEYIRDPGGAPIERAVAIWKAQMLNLVFRD